jgi:hypothetical protein
MSFLVESNLSLISFLIIYAMCNCIDLIMDAMFWYNDLIEDSIWEKKLIKLVFFLSFFKFPLLSII